MQAFHGNLYLCSPLAQRAELTKRAHPPAAAEPLQPNDLTDSRALNRARSRFGTACSSARTVSPGGHSSPQAIRADIASASMRAKATTCRMLGSELCCGCLVDARTGTARLQQPIFTHSDARTFATRRTVVHEHRAQQRPRGVGEAGAQEVRCHQRVARRPAVRRHVRHGHQQGHICGALQGGTAKELEDG